MKYKDLTPEQYIHQLSKKLKLENYNFQTVGETDSIEILHSLDKLKQKYFLKILENNEDNQNSQNQM